MIHSLDITSRSPLKDEVTLQVHGRLILWKSMSILGPFFVDPSQLSIEMFSTEKHEKEIMCIIFLINLINKCCSKK